MKIEQLLLRLTRGEEVNPRDLRFWMTQTTYEYELYEPVRDFFCEQGYKVRGEVMDCDVVAEREDCIIAIELKKNLNMKLILQGTLRQRVADKVYLAIEKPKKSAFTKEWNDKKYLLRRLNLGLIFVSKKNVQVILEAKEFDMKSCKRRNKKKKAALVKEFNGRSGDFNIGGKAKSKIITAYREEALKIAVSIGADGEKSIKELKDTGINPKCSSILQKNFYNWFERVSRGVYTLTDQGKRALEEYNDIITQINVKEIG